MPTAKQQQSVQDGKELTLGALFLLDNAPDPPHDMEWHEYSEWAIAEHLSRHSYYYYPKSKRTLATAATIRKRVLEICKYNAKKPIQERQHGFKDKVAFVFEHGGTDLLKEDFLKREEYDKTTFSESRLSKYASEGNGSASTETDARPEIGKAKEDKGSDTSNTSSHAVGQQERLEGEADAAAPIFTQPTLPSPPSNSGTTPQPPDNSRAAPNPNIVDTRERREQNEAISDEQPQPSRSEGRQLRSSVGPPTQTLSTNNAPPCVIEKTNTTPSEDDIGPHNTSVLGTKRKRTQDQGPRKRQCQVSDATHQDDSRASKASQNAVISREKQHELQLATLNLDEQGWNMERLYTDILRATEVVLASIGQIRNIPSALQPDPSSQLRDLYARCWGPRWKQMCAHQTNQCFFRTPGVTTSLLSAFLCEKILTQRAGLEELVGNVVKIGGSLGEALLEEFDFSARKAAITKRARMLEADKACSRLAQDSETLQQQLKLEADSLAKDASAIMAPHLAALSCDAKLHMLSSARLETDTLNVFESAFAKVIQRALHYKLQLLATGCEYAFTWPSPDEIFDPRNMQVDGGGSENDDDQSIVLFTVFPGLEIKPLSSNEMESLADAKAVVVVQRSEDRS